MELLEAKETIKEILNEYDKERKDNLVNSYTQWNAERRFEAIDTVLKALDNSISKDEVKKIIEDINETDAGDYIDAIQDLQELLGE